MYMYAMEPSHHWDQVIIIIEDVLISGVKLYNKGRLNVINTGVYLFQRVLNREVPLYTLYRENYRKEKFSEFGKK